MKRVLSILLCMTLLLGTALISTVSAEEGTVTLTGYFTVAEEDGVDDYGFTAYSDTGEVIEEAQPGDVVVYHIDATGFQGLSSSNYITIITAYTLIDDTVFEPFFYYDEETEEFTTDLETYTYCASDIIPASRFPDSTAITYVERGENKKLITCYYEWNALASNATTRKRSAISNDGDYFSIFLKVKDTAKPTTNAINLLSTQEDSRASAVGTSDISNASTNYGQFALNYQVVDPVFAITDDITYDVEVATATPGTIAAPAQMVKDGKQFIGWKVINNDGAARIGENMDCVPEAGSLVNEGMPYAGGTKTMTLEAVYCAVDTKEGAGIRWAAAESERGMRFETYVDTAATPYILVHGTIIAPYKNVAANPANFTLENTQSLTAVNVVDSLYYGTECQYSRYYGAVVDFERYFLSLEKTLPETTTVASLKLAARGYITVRYADLSTKDFYSNFDSNAHVRSIDQVAAAALADTNAPYSDKQIEILKILTNGKTADGSVYRTDAKDFQ